jgi:hypothetical protein
MRPRQQRLDGPSQILGCEGLPHQRAEHAGERRAKAAATQLADPLLA